MQKPTVDVVGLGLNATDTVVLVQEFPPLGGKERVRSISRQAGGQVATALVACQRLGLRTRYVGTVGGDEAGQFQFQSLAEEGVDVHFTRVVRGAPTQFGLIVLDESTGERTVFWDRDPRLAVSAADLKPEAVTSARALLVDGCDVKACIQAARWARRAGIPVVADLDTVYKGVEKLFPWIDYLLASANFLPAVTGRKDPFQALESLAREYRIPAPGVTLGREGSLVFAEGQFYYSPGFVVETLDTTGAGDIFHGAFVYGLLEGWKLDRLLDFSNAMAALNCTRLGARGGIATRKAAEKLMAQGARHPNPALERHPRANAKRQPAPSLKAQRKSL